MFTTNLIMEFNRNEKQQRFNSIRGILINVTTGDKFSNFTLLVGHEKTRKVNLVIKTDLLDKYKDLIVLNNKLNVNYYLTSKQDNANWLTYANVLGISAVSNI